LEYEPIFSETGFHNIRLEDFESIFVNSFNSQNRRKFLVERFRMFWYKLEEIEVDFEIWIDGSFVTKKTEPNDIDIAILHTPDQINQLSSEKKEILKYLFANPQETKLRYCCDVYFMPNIHPAELNYWEKWFGYSRNNQARGIARLFIHAYKSGIYLTDQKKK